MHFSGFIYTQWNLGLEYSLGSRGRGFEIKFRFLNPTCGFKNIKFLNMLTKSFMISNEHALALTLRANFSSKCGRFVSFSCKFAIKKMLLKMKMKEIRKPASLKA